MTTLLLCVALAAAAAEIDIELQRCLDNPNNASTGAMSGCIKRATQRAHQQILQTHKALRTVLPAEVRKSLDAGQSAWERYRRSEEEFVALQYNHLDGSLIRITRAMQGLDLLRARLELLSGYLAQHAPTVDENHPCVRACTRDRAAEAVAWEMILHSCIAGCKSRQQALP